VLTPLTGITLITPFLAPWYSQSSRTHSYHGGHAELGTLWARDDCEYVMTVSTWWLWAAWAVWAPPTQESRWRPAIQGCC